ncbi:ankyrin repeat-containing domain protein [Pyrenochaeta sp. MPI-SDFR-AT-0127]|nr:ankyrin repeat-containing domain protein [Pyrenochaeta sp. MPI-SDFR-AT-0127]
MDPLSVSAGIIAVLQLSSKVVGYLHDVKDASKDRAKCAIEAANLNSLFTVLRFRLEEGNSHTPWYTAVRALATENGPFDQYKQSLELLQSRMTDKGRLARPGNALVWKFKKEEIASILSSMERLKTLVQVALEMDHFKLSLAIKQVTNMAHSNTEAIKDDTGFLRSSLPILESKVDSLQDEGELAKHRKLVAWLSPMDFPAQQSDIIGRKQEGTCQWFLDSTEFATWLQQPKETLFCTGIPGAGKTMIAAIAIDHLLKSVQSSSVGVAYVYCNYKSKMDQNAGALLATILKQLVHTQPSMMGPVKRLYEGHTSNGTRAPIGEISDALRAIVEKFSTVHIVIDALDECQNDDGTRSRLMNQLQALQLRNDLRIMVTSRHIPEIIEEFSEAHRLEIRASDDDVRRFVAGQINHLPKCIQRDAALQQQVQEKVTQAVDGMFLLARLHVDSLCDKKTKSKVQSSLKTLRGGFQALDKAYDDAIKRIDGQLPGDAALAKRALSWISNAMRPLTTTEITHALSVEPKQEDFDPDNVPDIDDVVSVCAGLVTIDEESNVIRLVHYTTQEYLEGIQMDWNPTTQLELASICLTYLSFNTFRYSTEEDCSDESWIKQYALLNYAAQHWGHHARTVQPELCELALSFLQDEPLISCASRAAVFGTVLQGTNREQTCLHIVARFGLQMLLEKLLSICKEDQRSLINEGDCGGFTALALAAEHGHESVTILLLDNDTEMEFFRNSTALYVASREGHEGIVKLLLQKEPNVRSKDEYLNNALDVALSAGYERIVLQLLDAGADVNRQCKGFEHTLQLASYFGDEQIVELLLDRGASINKVGGEYGSAIQAASRCGHESIVRLLIDNGADVNVSGGKYGSAIQAASHSGHESIVRLLLDRGADINLSGGRHGSAIQAAACGSHESTIRLLLDRGADVNAECGPYRNAFGEALDIGEERILKLLLEKGSNVNVNTLGGFCGSWLNRLAFEGHTDVLRLAYEKHHADQSSQDSHSRNPLHFAARGAHLDTFEYLMSLGLDPTAEDAKGDGLLSYACSGGSLPIINAILGQDLPSLEGSNWSPLHWACRGGSSAVVERLTEEGFRGKCITVPEPEGKWCPISIAIFHGEGEMIDHLPASCKSLLGAAVDIVQIEGTGSTRFWCDGCFHVSDQYQTI